MQDISLVNIFFIITGIAVVIITILLAIGLFYVISFVRTLRRVARTAQVVTEIVSNDISELRASIKEKGFSAGSVAKFVKSIASKSLNNKK